MALEIRSLHLQFEASTPPLIDISNPFEIEKGASLLVAPSGSGKTTLLRLISGWYRAGDKHPYLAAIDASFSALRDVEFIGNHQTLLPWYTARQNIELRGRGDAGLTEEHWRDVGLPPEALDRFPYELSLGMYKRAELVAALCGSAKLLLLDEFFSSLDPEARHLCSALLRRDRNSDRAVMTTTHTPETFVDIPVRYNLEVNSGGQITGIGRVSDVRPSGGLAKRSELQ